MAANKTENGKGLMKIVQIIVTMVHAVFAPLGKSSCLMGTALLLAQSEIVLALRLFEADVAMGRVTPPVGSPETVASAALHMATNVTPTKDY
jgi:hypothetical protein